ncbi:MAG: hypothetical protein HWE22_08785 [Flavobacteriales bacterium]|nr:hypothetical protein [Flavobacteriales bacterium]PIE86982.1 MAG: hypothetical protein CSA03_01865 [Bacteroidota bacterium]
MKEEQQWIEDIVSVSERIKTPEIPMDVLQRIKQIPSRAKSTVDLVPKRTIWLVAASIAALVAINIYASRTTQTTNESSNSFGETYFSHLKQL